MGRFIVAGWVRPGEAGFDFCIVRRGDVVACLGASAGGTGYVCHELEGMKSVAGGCYGEYY